MLPLLNVSGSCFIDIFGYFDVYISSLFQIDKNGDGHIDLKELREALEACGFKIAGYQSRLIEEEFKNSNKTKINGKLTYDEFEKLICDLKANDVANTFRTAVSKRENLQHLGGTSEASNEGTTHSVRVEEQLAFSDWINSNLQHDPDLKKLLPIDSEGKNLYDKVKDGILLW